MGVSPRPLRLQEPGYHPITVYFPLVVHRALLMEPAETESKDGLDRYIEAAKGLAKRARAGDAACFKGAPYHIPAPPPGRDPGRPSAHPPLAKIRPIHSGEQGRRIVERGRRRPRFKISAT